MPVVRIAHSQFRPRKGEYADNVARIGAVITQAAQLDPKPELVVFPETATSGYFVEGGVKELAVTAGTLARDLAAVYQGPAIDVVVGFYERFQNHIYNSALYVTLGTKKPEVRHVHRKVFLPTYGVFDEERFVDRGQDGVRSFETGWGRGRQGRDPDLRGCLALSCRDRRRPRGSAADHRAECFTGARNGRRGGLRGKG